METTDITIRVLREIRDEVAKMSGEAKETNARLSQTNARLDQTNARLDQTRNELVRAIADSEIRTATAITGVTGALSDIKQLLSSQLDLRGRVERCETEIEGLKRRVAG